MKKKCYKLRELLNSIKENNCPHYKQDYRVIYFIANIAHINIGLIIGLLSAL